MAPTGKTEPVAVCLDADVLIAGLLSRTGASHAILILGEVGLLTQTFSARIPEVAKGDQAVEELGPFGSVLGA